MMGRYLAFIALATHLIGLISCAKENQAKKPDSELPRQELLERAALYCDLSKPQYDDDMNIGTGDGALFTSLHGLMCDYVTITQFEDEKNPGKLCRDPACKYVPPEHKTGFSKDMAVGMQFNISVKGAEKAFLQRIVDYGVSKSWVVCDANNTVDLISRCVMSPKIIGRWFDLLSGNDLTNLQSEESDDGDAWAVNTDFRAHLDIVTILTEWKMYNGISNGSLKTLKAQASRELENLLFQAAHRRFSGEPLGQVGKDLLAKFPADRLPNNHDDWCEEYLYQRDTMKNGARNPDWLPCPSEEFEEWSGTDFLVVVWVLTHEH